MTLRMFDPASATEADWPEGDSDARRYIEGIAKAGVAAMVANVRTQWLALRIGDRVVPVTVNTHEIGDSYVCLPHSAYALYARQELDLVDVGALRPLFRVLVALADRLLRAADVNRIVHIDNWLLSTNLHGDWQGEALPEIRSLLAARFPDHILAIRSLDPWSCPALLDATRRDGWVLWPSRQIWVVDDLDRNWRPRKAVKEDARMIAKSPYVCEDLRTLTSRDADRAAELYRMLYVDKYSALNPVFTPAFVEMTHRTGVMRYRGARDAGGNLVAIAGSLARGDVLTPPVVGYDTTRPQSEGLYRIACWLFGDAAARTRLRLNGSAGAAGFKRYRGAVGEIEYMALSVDHLSPARRVAIGLVALFLNRIAAPMMRKRGL